MLLTTGSGLLTSGSGFFTAPQMPVSSSHSGYGFFGVEPSMRVSPMPAHRPACVGVALFREQVGDRDDLHVFVLQAEGLGLEDSVLVGDLLRLRRVVGGRVFRAG